MLTPRLPLQRPIVSSPHLQVFESGALNILDARDSDYGLYMCQANNGVGPGLSKVVRVTINGKLHSPGSFVDLVPR